MSHDVTIETDMDGDLRLTCSCGATTDAVRDGYAIALTDAIAWQANHAMTAKQRAADQFQQEQVAKIARRRAMNAEHDPLKIYHDEDDDHWTVSGDLREVIDRDDESTNYIVADLLRREGAWDLDPEYSCFFGYTTTEDGATALKADALRLARGLTHQPT
jgi:hypothetical protein